MCQLNTLEATNFSELVSTANDTLWDVGVVTEAVLDGVDPVADIAGERLVDDVVVLVLCAVVFEEPGALVSVVEVVIA